MHITENDQITNVDDFVMNTGDPVTKNQQNFLRNKTVVHFGLHH